MADSVTPVSRSKKATKNCSFCGAEQPIARKQCSECFTHFPKVQKSLEKIKQMGQTNVTQQRKLMEKRADILNVRHNCDVIIIMKNRHGDGDSLNVYGTAGAGVTFIGNKSTVKPSEGGAVTLQLFDRFLRDFYRSQTGSLPSTADDGPDSNPTESGNSTASTPNTQSTAITQIGSASAIQTDETPPVSSCNTSNKDSNSESGNSATCTASTPNTQSTANTQSSCSATAIQTDETPPVSSSNSPNKDSNSKSGNSATCTASTPNTQSTANTQSSCSATAIQPVSSCNSSKAMVVYMRDSVVLAGGQVEENRRKIHGKTIPSDHVCVLLTTAQQRIEAPFLAGDPEENAFLEKGKFFAFPKKFLYVASFQNNYLRLMPFVASN